MDNFEIQSSDEYLISAVSAIETVVDLFNDGYGKATSSRKSDNSIVTDYDIQIEAQLTKILQEVYPNSGVIGEESGVTVSESAETVWIIDPIDGTINYKMGSLPSAIAIGIERYGELYGGVIALPQEDIIYYGCIGDTAYVNDTEVTVANPDTLAEYVVSAEFRPVNLQTDGYLEMVQDVAETCETIRCIRSGVTDGAYVASGRHHVAYNMDTNIWDVAAPTALVRAAGGTVTTPAGDNSWQKIKQGNALYTTGENHQYFTQFFTN